MSNVAVPAPELSAEASRSGRWWVWGIAAIAGLMVVAAMAGFLWHDWRKLVEDNATLSERRAARLANEVAQAVRLARIQIDGLEHRMAGAPSAETALAALRETLAVQAPLLAALPVPLRVRPVLAGDPEAAQVSARLQALLPRAEPGGTVIPLLRPAAANPHGVRGWRVDIDQAALVGRFESSRLPQGGGVALLRIDPDGATTLLARAPHDAAELGRTVRGPLAAAAARAPRGTFEAVTQIDPLRRVLSFERLDLEGMRLVLSYGVSYDALVAPWRRQLPWAAAVLLALLAVIAAGARRLDRSLGVQRLQREALARNEREFRALAENLPDVVVRFDRDGRHLYANQAVEGATGLQPQAFIGKTNAELGMPADNVRQWVEALGRVFATGTSERLEFAFPGPQGLRHWESLIVREPLAADARPTALVISRDITERKDAEAARTALHRRLADVLESMSDGFVGLDRAWRYVAVNPRAAELLGRDPTDLLGKCLWTEFPALAGQPFQHACERALADGTPVVVEVHYAPWDRWFENRIFPGADGVNIFFNDVTPRRRTADALRASEASHREMFESNPHPMWVYDLETLAFLAVNDAAVRQYGYSRDEFLHLTLKDIRPPEDVQRLLANVAAVGEGYDDAGTWRHRTKEGRLLEVEITSHTLRFDGRPAELVLAHDVTRRNEAERTLRISEERLRLALEAAHQGLYDLDLRTGDAVVSPEYASMLGYDPTDFRETHAAWRERLHPDDRDAVFQAFEDYVTGRRADYRVEFRQRTRDGRWKWILSLGRIQERDAEGRPVRMLGTHTDLDAIKAAQAAQVAARERFEKLFRAAPEAMSVSGIDDGRFLQVNDAFCELFGHARDQVVGRTSFELDLWSDTRGREEVVERLRAGQAVSGFEGVARRGDGTPIDVLFSAERIDFDGREALLLMFRDISQRKRLEEALRASEARLSHLLARAPVVIYTARASGDYGATYYSPNLPQLLGWEPRRFIEDSGFWLDHVHPDDRPSLLAALEDLATHDELVLEYRFQHADGRWRWMHDEVSLQRDTAGAPVEIVGAWIDITARRDAEDAVRRLAAELEQRVQERTAQLAHSEARYRTIFETVPVSISEEDWSGVQSRLRRLRDEGVVDGPGYFEAHPEFVHDCLRAVKLQRINRKGLALHDAEAVPSGAAALTTFFPAPGDARQFQGELEAMWAGQRLFTAKRSLPSVNGRPLSLMMTISLPALDDADGTSLVCIVDITEIDRLNAELDRSVERLKQVNRELETFTYSVSHDLKAPLRGIDGYSRLLLADHAPRLDTEGRQFLENIRRATRQMGLLIDDLLSYSRLERRDLALGPLALAPIVSDVVAALDADVDLGGAEIEVRVDPSLRAQGDAQGLAIALRNVVDNAIKFSRDRQPPRIVIEAVRAGGRVRLSVRDNGVGFDMKFHDRIFSIFQRLHRAEDYAGTGVGLAIVRKALERMGGRVWADSRPGEGATFTLELPAADAA